MSDAVDPKTDEHLEGVVDTEETAEADGPVSEAASETDEVGVDDPYGSGEEPTPELLEEIIEGVELGRESQQLQAELDTLNDRHLRLAAEFSNFRRRAETQMADSWGRGQADLLRHMLDALDDLQRVGAWEPETATVDALVEGVDLVERKIRQALEAAGVEFLDPINETFDPNYMEAMFRVPTDDEAQDDVVQDVLQKGYVLNGHLVRPARVSVFKHE